MKHTKVLALELILLTFLSYALVFLQTNTRKVIVSIFLLLIAIISKFILNKKKTLSIRKKEAFKLVTLLSFIYVALLYTIGIYTGFYKAVVKFNFNTLTDYIIPIIVIVISSEYIRHKIINYNSKITSILNFIIQVLIDILIFANSYKLNSIDNILTLVGYVIFSSIASNLLFNYISKRYGIKPNIVYRLFTILYLYIIPITPDIYIFFLSFYKMAYPFLMYYLLESFFGETEDVSIIKENKPLKVITTVLFIILLIYIGLISCLFKYGALVIGSGSMTGTINKGDVIIFTKDIDIEDVSKKDIIVFIKNDIKVVHRVYDKKVSNNQYRLYTKGDNNKKVDEGYVTKDELYGNVIYKIKKIGLPTIWLHEMFEK